MRPSTMNLLVTCVLLTACGGDDAPQEETAAAMPAMRMPSMDMVPAMRAYLDSMVRAEPGELVDMVATHGARIETMLAAMDTDMRAMSMMADSAWQSLADSIRVDLSTVPGLTGEDLVLAMRAHGGRMRRLIEMHERMMAM